MCFCFSSLYYFEDINVILREINRLLSKDGIAVLEFATKDNINAFVSNYRAKHNNWGKPYFLTYSNLLESLKKEKLKIIEEKHFQLLPVLRGPWWSLFFANSFLKPILHKKIGKKTIDEHISSISFLKRFAFKHIIVLKKDEPK